MNKRIFFSTILALAVGLVVAPVSQAALHVPGDYQFEFDTSTNWDNTNAPTMTDQGGGLFDLDVSSLTAGNKYEFAILDDLGSPPPDWGDKISPDSNSWFIADPNGDATISIDTNTYADDFLPATNRITVSTDATAVSTFYATGNWMDNADPNASDWDPGYAGFQMVDQGGGLYTLDVTIDVPGLGYEFKVTKGDWAGQWGTNGRCTNAATWVFNTVAVDQAVTFSLDISKGAILFETDTFLDGDVDNDGDVDMTDFGIIRDNWNNNTFLRSEGDLNSNGVVDIADFRQWKDSYVPPSGVAVPEPGSVMLAALAGLALVGRRRLRG